MPEIQQTTHFRILVVDDEVVNHQVIANYLDRRSYDLVAMTSATHAFESIRQNKPDLILLDVRMPQMSGFEFCRKVRELYSLFDLPILFLTARNQITDLVEGLTAGGNDYLTKPFSKAELVARINNQLQLCVSKSRYSIFHEFTESLHHCKNIDQLVESTFHSLARDPHVMESALFKDSKPLFNSLSNSAILDQLTRDSSIFEDRDLIKLDDHHVLFSQFNSIGNSLMVIRCKSLPSEVDLEFYRKLINHTLVFKKHLSELAGTPILLSELSLLSAKRKTIVYIKAEQGVCQAFEKGSKTPLELNLSLSTIRLFFNEETFLQPHRGYLVNKEFIHSVTKVSKNKYEIFTGQHSVPIGRSYLAKFKDHFPICN